MNGAPAARYYRQKVEVPYGIVIGFNKTINDPKNFEELDPINLIHIDPFDATKLEVSRTFCPGVIEGEPCRLDLLEQALRALNVMDHKVVTLHNGYKDSSCNFNGFHWHIVADCRLHPTADARWGKEISRQGFASNKCMYIKTMVANNVIALAKHIVKAPRQHIISTGKYSDIKGDSGTDPTTISPSEPDWSGAKLSEDVNHSRVTNIVKLMKKYHTPDLGILKQKIICQSMQDWETFVQLMCLPSWDTISKKAMELYKTEDRTFSFEMRFHRPYSSFNGETDCYLSTFESWKLFAKWCNFQTIDHGLFVERLKNVLAREIPKKNTFCLVGEASSGKSYVIRSILPYYSYFGETHGMEGSYAFLWQGLMDCSLGLMEECYITPAMVDQAKLVFEGSQTMVKVKCKPDGVLQPLPILITSNNNPWFHCSGSRQALQDRMYYYETHRMEDLAEVKKGLNPNMWYYIFQYMKTNHTWDDESIKLMIEGPPTGEPEDTIVEDIHASAKAFHDKITKTPEKTRKRTIESLWDDEDGQHLPTTQEIEDCMSAKFKDPVQQTIDEVVNNSQDLFVPDTPPPAQKKKKLTTKKAMTEVTHLFSLKK